MGNRLGGVLVCLLFAIPFGGVGVFASWAIGKMLSDGWSAREWVRVRAQVDSADLHASANRRSETYRAEGRYRYTFEGREYASERLGISPLGGSDNVGDWQEEIAARLDEARASGKPITVWVNPANPSEAAVDREIRWPMVVFLSPFAIAFGGIGVAALVAAFFVGRGGKDGPERTAAGRRAARAARGRPNQMTLGGLWGFTLVWNAIAFPIAILAVPEIIEDGEWVGLLVLLFPLIGLLMLWGAVVSTWKWFIALITGRSGEPGPAPAALAATPGPLAARPPSFEGLEGHAPAAHAPAFDRLEPPTAATAFTGFHDRGGFASAQAELPIPEGVARVEEAHGTLRLDYRRGGRRAIGVALAVLGALFVALAILGTGLLGDLGLRADFDWAFAGILLVPVGWRLARSRLAVTAKAGEIQVSGHGFLGRVERTLRRGEISALTPAHAYSVSRGSGPMREVYSLHAVLRDGQRVTIGTGFEGKELAESAQARIARAAGLDPGLLRPAVPDPKMSANED